MLLESGAATDEEITLMQTVDYSKKTFDLQYPVLADADPEAINSKAFLWTRKQRFFKEGQIAIAFLRLTPDTWLLTTIKHIDKVLDVDDGVGYGTGEVSEILWACDYQVSQDHAGTGCFLLERV